MNTFNEASITRSVSTNSEPHISVDDLLKSRSARLLTEHELTPLIRTDYGLREIPRTIQNSRYWKLSLLPSASPINSDQSHLHYQKHLWNMKDLLKNASGRVLDVGCGEAEVGAALFPASCSYVGLDPLVHEPNAGQFVGAAEDLPFVNSCFDSVLFNTSLDHVLDYGTAIREARRVLRDGGSLYVATLVWHTDFSLLSDDVHFHHFKQFEIDGIMEFSGFEIVSSSRAQWKTDKHRDVFYARYSAC